MNNYVINVDGMGNFTDTFENLRWIRGMIFGSIREAQRAARDFLVPIVEQSNERYPWRFEGFEWNDGDLVPRFYCWFTGEYLNVPTFYIEKEEVYSEELI